MSRQKVIQTSHCRPGRSTEHLYYRLSRPLFKGYNNHLSVIQDFGSDKWIMEAPVELREVILYIYTLLAIVGKLFRENGGCIPRKPPKEIHPFLAMQWIMHAFRLIKRHTTQLSPLVCPFELKDRLLGLLFNSLRSWAIPHQERYIQQHYLDWTRDNSSMKKMKVESPLDYASIS